MFQNILGYQGSNNNIDMDINIDKNIDKDRNIDKDESLKRSRYMDMEFRDNFEIINSLIDYSENITYNYQKELEII